MKAYNVGIKKLTLTVEKVFVLYFFGFLMLRPIIALFQSFSTIILLFYAVLMIGASLQLRKGVYINRNLISICSIFLLIFLSDFIFRPNSYTFRYFQDFIIFALIPIFLLSQVDDIQELLKFYAKLSFVLFFIFIWHPLLPDFGLFNEEMDYGFNFLLPVILGVNIGRRMYNYRWGIIEILCLIAMLVFSNRSLMLTTGIYYIIVYLMPKKNWGIYLLFAITFFTVFYLFFAKSFFIGLHEWLLNKGYDSYPIHKMHNFFKYDQPLDSFFSGRLAIWKDAQNITKENIWIGSGTAYYHSLRDRYVHNIYFDIIIQYGIIGCVFFFFLLAKSFIKLFNSKREIKQLGILFLCLWFPRLLLSAYFYEVIGFWCFIAFTYMNFKNYNSTFTILK